MNNSDPVISIRNLNFSWHGKAIFRDLNMRMEQGQISAIMGPSGVGKSTLLKLITAQLTPDSGQILVFGQNVHRLSRRALFQLRVKMGMLFQHDALLAELNVFDNVAYPLREHQQLSSIVLTDKVLAKLHSVGLEQAANLMPSELSGGMSRRVALARAMAMEPQLMLYDEPFTGQDPVSMGVLQRLIQTLNTQAELSSVLVSHDVTETLAIADSVYLLSAEGIVEAGTSDAIRQSSLPWVRQFINAQADGPVPFHYQSGSSL